MDKKEAIERINLLKEQLIKVVKENSINDDDWKPYVETMNEENPEAVNIVKYDHEIDVLTKAFHLTDKDLE